MRLISTTFASACLVALAAPASAATTINFDGAPAVFTSYSEGGATIRAVDNGKVDRTIGPNGTNTLLTEDTGLTVRPELRADFASASSIVSIDLGDFGSDADLAFLEVFNASNASLGFTSLLISPTDATMHTLSLTRAGIAYAIFGGRPPSVNGSSPYADNLSFQLGEGGGVPEPAAWALMIGGFSVAGTALRYRRRRARVVFG